MIPDFNEHGYLPAGVHPASLDEIEERFGRQSEIRQVQMESLRWLTELAKRAGVQRLIINGSFVTERLEPNDVGVSYWRKRNLLATKSRRRNFSQACRFWKSH